jgi:hypothetical protein
MRRDKTDPPAFNPLDFHVVITGIGIYEMLSWPLAICAPQAAVLKMDAGLLMILLPYLPGKGLLPFVAVNDMERFKQCLRLAHVPTSLPELGDSHAALQELFDDLDAAARDVLERERCAVNGSKTH